jgi:hypothetical protein
LIFVILGILSVLAVVATIVSISRDGHHRVADRPSVRR